MNEDGRELVQRRLERRKEPSYDGVAPTTGMRGDRVCWAVVNGRGRGRSRSRRVSNLYTRVDVDDALACCA